MCFLSVVELFASSGPYFVVVFLCFGGCRFVGLLVPLDDVDTFGGSIVTEWYAPDEDPYKRLKLAVFVVGMELRSDAIKVRAYVQVKSADKKEWITAGRDKKLARKIEDLILTRAREMRAAAVSETSE